jgi:hypothetical protein
VIWIPISEAMPDRNVVVIVSQLLPDGSRRRSFAGWRDHEDDWACFIPESPHDATPIVADMGDVLDGDCWASVPNF